MDDLIVAIGLLFVIEGLVMSLLPGSVKRLAKQVLQYPEQTMRVTGLIAMVVGVAVVWFVRH